MPSIMDELAAVPRRGETRDLRASIVVVVALAAQEVKGGEVVVNNKDLQLDAIMLSLIKLLWWP